MKFTTACASTTTRSSPPRRCPRAISPTVSCLPKFADVPAVKERRVFNNNRRQTLSGGSDFWESGNVRPDRILCDLRTIFSGGDADSLWYYKRLK